MKGLLRLSGVLGLATLILASDWRVRAQDGADQIQGLYVYQRNCQTCHGRRGDGRGEMGLTVIPRPRNFTTGVFKYRTTPSGSLPTDPDLRRVIRQGISGTAMPIFSALPDRDVESVIAYLKTFSPRWRHEKPLSPLPGPEFPDWWGKDGVRAGHVQAGRELFLVSCAPCHGLDGAGTGATVTNELTDAWGEKVRPADLRQTGLRSGPGLEDVFRTLSTGLDGTPMPSFAEAHTPEQRWEIAAFIGELRRTNAAAGVR